MAENETMSAVEAGAQTAENAAAEAGVVAPQEADSGANTQEQQTASGSDAEGGQSKPAQNRDTNSAYKGIRRRAEAYDDLSNGVMSFARSKGLQPKDAAEAVKMLQADAAGKSYEEYQREEAAAEAELEERARDSRVYRDLAAQAERDRTDAEAYRANERMRKDLAAIQAVDPSVTSLEQLGDEYKELVRNMNGLDAYYVIKGRQAVQNAAMPPATGDVGRKTDMDRDFTSEELDHLNYDDLLKDDKLYKKAMRSMLKLGKQ